MDGGRKQIGERILNLTLEIIYLLTGEDYIVVKKIREEDEGWSRRNQDPIGVPLLPSLMHKGENYQEILELTSEMTELLTGEVPIRYEDVTVYFSMEEWEYLEGHKDQYEDIMVENHQTFTPQDECSKKEMLEKCLGPLYPKGYPDDNQDVSQDLQVTDLADIKVEVITKEEETYVGVSQMCKEEKIPRDIGARKCGFFSSRRHFRFGKPRSSSNSSSSSSSNGGRNTSSSNSHSSLCMYCLPHTATCTHAREQKAKHMSSSSPIRDSGRGGKKRRRAVLEPSTEIITPDSSSNSEAQENLMDSIIHTAEEMGLGRSQMQEEVSLPHLQRQERRKVVRFSKQRRRKRTGGQAHAPFRTTEGGEENDESMPYINTEHLITMVELRPPLWDKEDAQHSDLSVTRRLWLEIFCALLPDYNEMASQRQLNIGSFIQRRWRSMRDRFIRDLRMDSNVPNGSEPTRRTEYKFAKILQFLRKCFEQRQYQGAVRRPAMELVGPPLEAAEVRQQNKQLQGALPLTSLITSSVRAPPEVVTEEETSREPCVKKASGGVSDIPRPGPPSASTSGASCHPVSGAVTRILRRTRSGRSSQSEQEALKAVINDGFQRLDDNVTGFRTEVNIRFQQMDGWELLESLNECRNFFLSLVPLMEKMTQEQRFQCRERVTAVIKEILYSSPPTSFSHPPSTSFPSSKSFSSHSLPSPRPTSHPHSQSFPRHVPTPVEYLRPRDSFTTFLRAEEESDTWQPASSSPGFRPL